MPQFTVLAKGGRFYQTQVYAEDEEKAAEIASELTERDFQFEYGCEWEILRIERVLVKPEKAFKKDHEKPKQTGLF
jgi:hypothetical protein